MKKLRVIIDFNLPLAFDFSKKKPTLKQVKEAINYGLKIDNEKNR